MVDIITQQKMNNVDRDISDIGKAATQDTEVTSRLGLKFDSIPRVARKGKEQLDAVKNQLQADANNLVALGFYKSYQSEAELLIDTPDIVEMRARADDTRKIWRWVRSSLSGVKPIVGQWIDTGKSDYDLVLDFLSEELKGLLLEKNRIIDEDGNKYLLSILNNISNKILFGVTTKGEATLGDIKLYQDDNQWLLQDGAGRTFVRYKDEQLHIFDYKIDFKSSGIVLLDRTGKALFKLSNKGTLYAAKYLNIPENSKNTISVDYQIGDAGQFKETNVTHELVYGQSLSISTAESIPVQSTKQDYGNLMFKGGVRFRVGDSGFDGSNFAPLIEDTKETPCSGICNGLSVRFNKTFGRRNPPTQKYLGTTTGESGRSVQFLSAAEDGGSSSLFERTIEAVRLAKELCDKNGETYAVGSYNWIQGENDSTTPFYQYIARLRNLKQRLDQNVLSVTGQRFRPAMYIAQTAAHRRYNQKFFNASLAQLRLSNQYEDMVLAVPIYQLPHGTDNLHLSGLGAWLMGQYIARASFHTRYLGEKWKPLQPSWVKWESLQIIVGGWNPKGTTLVLDDALCALVENYGFDLFDSNDVLLDIISTVELIDSTTIKLTLKSEAPLDARLCLARGRDNMNGTAMGGPITGARSNVRDDHGEYDQVINPFDSKTYKLHNASVMWQYDRQNGFNSI
ncbi:hypothetical protein G9F31_00760 [Acinetobacter sp. 187]|uniref:hypothetical protein n=1 Tax=Acinetobacter lanii TaxID=2715163 RepID=UPI00140AF38C|nr:hypothetical protein [Acinetobacter lanii]NHC02315.1 hypothetical protein [Acinetobacter lanii]